MANFLINVLKKFQNKVTLTSNSDFKTMVNNEVQHSNFEEEPYLKEIETLEKNIENSRALKAELIQNLKQKVSNIIEEKIEKCKSAFSTESSEPLSISVKLSNNNRKTILEEKLLNNYYKIQKEKIQEHREIANEIANSLSVRIMAFEEEFKNFLLDQQSLHESLKDLSKSGLAFRADLFRKEFK